MAADITIEQDTASMSPQEAYDLYQKTEAGEAMPVQIPEKSTIETVADAAVDQVPMSGKADAGEVAGDKGTSEAAVADGIESKNGKHILPFTVLAGEREQRQAAQRELMDAKTALDKAQAELEQLRASKNSTPGDADTERANELMDKADLSPQELQELQDDFPTVYKAVVAIRELSQKTAEQIASKVDPMQKAYESAQEQRANQLRASVQEAIDANPKLAHIQANDPAMFYVTQQYDDVLKQMPAWADKPMAERFAQALAMAEASIGKSVEIVSTKADAPQARDLKAQALAQAKAQHADMPTSLQQFPAGGAPKETALDEVRDMSAGQVRAKLASMSSAEQDAFLASL